MPSNEIMLLFKNWVDKWSSVQLKKMLFHGVLD